ncbi:Rv3235 family protein, partial [Nocardia wallacei]|uniref:Rv3235 family protein n=1 Tax=Nocardia wallacei TaxID=480035 RepID=UPI0024569DDF
APWGPGARGRGPPGPSHGGPAGAGGAAARGGAPRRSPHDGRSTSYASQGETDSATKRFAERSLRLVLEVVDGRRPVAQLGPVAEPTVLAAVETLARTGAAERRLGPAVLASVRTTTVAPGAAEVCGGYDRGNRRFAVAARIVARRGEWRLAALRLR